MGRFGQGLKNKEHVPCFGDGRFVRWEIKLGRWAAKHVNLTRRVFPFFCAVSGTVGASAAQHSVALSVRDTINHIITW